MMLEKQEQPANPECSALCGNKAKGIIKVTEEISLPICDMCREKIDPDHQWIFVPLFA